MRWQTWVGSAALALPFIIGTATGAETDGNEAFRFADPQVNESSGLVVLPSGDVVTVNDSGDSARVFVIDPETGQTQRTVTWDAEAVDIEALAPAGDDAVWVADIGDNRHLRTSVTLTHLPLDGRAATTYELRYPDGSRDAEALLAHPVTGRLHVVTKGVFGGSVMAVPADLRADRPNELEQVATTGGLVTDGAYLPGGGAVVLRDYGRAWVVDATSWQTVTSWSLPRQQQGEGLAVDADGTHLLLSSEGVGAPVLREELPAAAAVTDVVASPLWPAVRAMPWVWWRG